MVLQRTELTAIYLICKCIYDILYNCIDFYALWPRNPAHFINDVFVTVHYLIQRIAIRHIDLDNYKIQRQKIVQEAK